MNTDKNPVDDMPVSKQKEDTNNGENPVTNGSTSQEEAKAPDVDETNRRKYDDGKPGAEVQEK